MKKVIYSFAASLMFVLFTSSAWVKLTLTRPSELILPEHIKTIALIDRTLQEETPQNKLEQVITGEVFHQDEQAILKVADGCIDGCSGINRF